MHSMTGLVFTLTHKKNTHSYVKGKSHTLTATHLIWSVISRFKAWQKANSLYGCNVRSVVGSTQVWPRGT